MVRKPKPGLGDPEAEAPPGPGHNNPPGDETKTVPERLAIASRRALDLAAHVKALEEEVSGGKAELATLKRSVLPDLLLQLGSGIWQGDGMVVSQGPKIAGTLAKSSDPEKAVAYLTERGFGDAIRSTVTVDFAEDDRASALATFELLQATFGERASIERKVNPQTLAKWARTEIAEGRPVDTDLLGLAMWKEANVKDQD